MLNYTKIKFVHIELPYLYRSRAFVYYEEAVTQLACTVIHQIRYYFRQEMHVRLFLTQVSGSR